ncbi:tRNA (adenine(22)-N(1))-methyltransferase [Neorhodopirellula lusitana]|uniref:tRNA (adenine(22)-N(1))-methyltransferase n=1 Tax=Neorhodopirellula lusitana TaxID=445327 RepID=UPI00384E68A1
MPRLDERLKAVARIIRCDIHMDVGSDHGHLLFALLKSGRVSRGIAIENKQRPYLNSRTTLADVNADVRFGEGLAAANPGEADSLSICGMGGRSIVRILSEYPDRVPSQVILQPNQRIHLVRRWGYENGFTIAGETWVGTDRIFEILHFVRQTTGDGDFVDPAYEGFDLETAFHFGPTHLRQRAPEFLNRLQEERQYFGQFPHRQPATEHRLRMIAQILGLDNH